MDEEKTGLPRLGGVGEHLLPDLPHRYNFRRRGGGAVWREHSNRHDLSLLCDSLMYGDDLERRPGDGGLALFGEIGKEDRSLLALILFSL